MAAKLSVKVPGLWLPLVGVKEIAVTVDGQQVAAAAFGQTVTCDIAPGARNVAIVLRSIIERTSNNVIVNVADESHVALTAKYSRMLGTFHLKVG